MKTFWSFESEKNGKARVIQSFIYVSFCVYVICSYIANSIWEKTHDFFLCKKLGIEMDLYYNCLIRYSFTYYCVLSFFLSEKIYIWKNISAILRVRDSVTGEHIFTYHSVYVLHDYWLKTPEVNTIFIASPTLLIGKILKHSWSIIILKEIIVLRLY